MIWLCARADVPTAPTSQFVEAPVAPASRPPPLGFTLRRSQALTSGSRRVRGRMGGGEDVRPRAIDEPRDQLRLPATKPPAHSRALCSACRRGRCDLVLNANARRRRGRGAKDARGVGLVHQQHAVVAAGQFGDFASGANRRPC